MADKEMSGADATRPTTAIERMWGEGCSSFVTEFTRRRQSPNGWEKAYEKRRQESCEPRVMRQTQLESAWEGTTFEDLWRVLRLFASPGDNYQLDKAQLVAFARQAGIISPLMRDMIATLFITNLHQHNSSGTPGSINALHVCKALELCFADSTFREVLAGHCFNDTAKALYGLPCDVISCSDIDEFLGREEEEDQRKPDAERLERERHEKGMLAELRDVMKARDVAEAAPDAFRELLFSGNPIIVTTFLRQILEVCVRQLQPPFGSFPVISLRWIKSTEGLPYDPNTPQDADSLLLQQAEKRTRSRGRQSEKRTRSRGRQTRSR